MFPLLELYLEKLKDFYQLQKALYIVLEPLITLKSVDEPNYKFSPAHLSISEQIKHWPEGEFLIPPAAWVQPRKGHVQLNSDMWEFAFHGGGLSFIHTSTRQDISIEYSAKGDLSITRHTFLIYLETLQQDDLDIQSLLEQYDNLFDEVVQLKYLEEVPPLLPSDDQTYIFVPPS